MLTPSGALVLAVLSAVSSTPPAADTDRDGLSDFLEVHKYLTDPTKIDSDGDGKPDGDWLERREYAYTVRSIVQVMRPVTAAFLNDAYQDVRVLDETDTYVATFHDWADARMWETVGRRSTFSNAKKKRDVFGHHNPYSTIALRDSFGAHSKVQNPPLEPATMTVEAIYWTDSKALLNHLERADNQAKLTSASVPDVWTRFHPGCVWFKSDRGFLYLPIDEEDREKIVAGTTYRVTTPNRIAGPHWSLHGEITR